MQFIWRTLIALSLLTGPVVAQQVLPAPNTAALVCAYNASPPVIASGNFLYVQCDSSGKVIASGGSSGGSPGGSTNSVQYNSGAGAFGGTLLSNGQLLEGQAGAPTAFSPGTGALTALSVNVGTAGAFVVNGGALGTPSGGTLTNATGLPIATGISGFGTGAATALAVNIGSAGAFVVNGGALGTPSSGNGANLTAITAANISAGTAGISITGSANLVDTANDSRVYEVSTGFLGFWANHLGTIALAEFAYTGASSGPEWRQGSTTAAGWTATTDATSGAMDIATARESAGVLKVTDGTVSGYGTVDAAGLKVSGTAGASCTLTTVSHLTVVNGIVTLCD